LDALGYDTTAICESARWHQGIDSPRYAAILIEQERKYRQAMNERFLDSGIGDPRD